MNQTEKNLNWCLKTAVFMILCLVAFVAIGNQNSEIDSFQGNILTKDVQTITAHAILTTPIVSMTSIPAIFTPTDKCHFNINNKIAFDSRLCIQRLMTLQKNREIIIPLHRFRNYLPVIPPNKDDLPDLS